MENNNSNNGKITFETKVIPEEYDYLAAAGSEIRLLRKVREDDLIHFTLPPQRVSFKKDLEKAGGKLVASRWIYTMGEHDSIVILEAPNDEVVTKIILLSTAS
jgi:hypothetical protein